MVGVADNARSFTIAQFQQNECPLDGIAGVSAMEGGSEI